MTYIPAAGEGGLSRSRGTYKGTSSDPKQRRVGSSGSNEGQSNAGKRVPKNQQALGYEAPATYTTGLVPKKDQPFSDFSNNPDDRKQNQDQQSRYYRFRQQKDLEYYQRKAIGLYQDNKVAERPQDEAELVRRLDLYA